MDDGNTTIKASDPLICRRCGKVTGSFAGLVSHMRIHDSRLDVDRVKRLLQDGYTFWGVCDELGVGDRTLRAFLDEHGLSTDSLAMARRRKDTEHLDLVFELAPMLGKAKQCERCDYETECYERLVAGWWVLCEAPEQIDVTAAELAGFLSPA